MTLEQNLEDIKLLLNPNKMVTSVSGQLVEEVLDVIAPQINPQVSLLHRFQ